MSLSTDRFFLEEEWFPPIPTDRVQRGASTDKVEKAGDEVLGADCGGWGWA
jgi:hypothetical protein